MSQQEQDRIIGELIRKRKETAATVAAIEVKLHGFLAAHESVKGAVESNSLDEAIAFMSAVPDRGAIKDTLIELKDKKEELGRISRQLSHLDI